VAYTGSTNIAAGSIPAPAPVVNTYSLQASVDNVIAVGANAVINAATGTFSGLDTINGGTGGSTTLNIIDTGTANGAVYSIPSGVTVTNVQTANITTSGTFGDIAVTTLYDLSGWTGLTQANLSSSSTNTRASDIKLGSTTALNLVVNSSAAVVNTVAGGTAVSVASNGTDAVTVSGAALTSVTLTGGGAKIVDNTSSAGASAVGTTLTSVTLNDDAAADAIKGAGLSNITLIGQGAGGTPRTITLTNATSKSLTINASGTGYQNNAAATENKTAFIETAATATSVTVNTTVKSSLDLTGITTLTSVVLTGSGALKFYPMGSSVLSLDGSPATGSLTLGSLNAALTTVSTGSGNDTLTLNATTKSTVSTGAGNDTVTLGAVLAAGSSINLGAGNDKLLGTSLPATSLSATSVIDGGDGIDTLSIGLVNAGNASLFKNFENLSVSAANVSLDASLVSGITGLTIDAAAAAPVLSGLTPSQSLTDNFVGDNSANTTTLTFASSSVAGTSDTYNITFAGSAQTSAPTSANALAGTIAASGIENFNIASTSAANTWNSLTLGADTSARTVVITGAQKLDVAFAANFGEVNAGNGTVGVSLIDGSAATGALSINEANVVAATAGLTVKGGSGADTLTTSTFSSTLTGNSGADTFNVTAAIWGQNANTGGVITTITDASPGDLIKFDTTAVNLNNTAVNVSAATNLATALGAASTAAAVAHTVEWFVYGGNTYLLDSAAIGTGTLVTTGDIVVKLAGQVDLTAGHASIAAGVLTLA
jgi:S-layer protein